MMSITIPPAALEAGTDIIRDYRKAGVTSDNIARVAFLAMLGAWPGMHFIGNIGVHLPLPTEASDDKA